MEFVTLNTSLIEQNHHQFKKADDAPQKNIKLSAVLQKEIRLTGIDKPGSPHTLKLN